ncbi:sugar phosphate isomerase/epimerase family protein [Spirillospora sp. CA-255316]
MKRSVGVAHLSALHLTPPDLVEAAALRGFDFVGTRVRPATAGESRYPVDAGSPMSDETARAMSATGVSVLDVECFSLSGTQAREEWQAVLRAGAALGARVLNVIGADTNRSRLVDVLGQLVLDAREFGIRPSLEPISYQAVRTVDDAAGIAKVTGCGLMLDVLHFMRAGGSPEQLLELPKGTVTAIQLCDGPAEPPEFTPPARLPMNQSVDGSSLQLESRSKRLVPGTGTFPLTEILRALPGVPVSVEVPDVVFVDSYGTDAHVDRLAEAVTHIVEAENAEGAVG